jgi:signal transduction histidine kinase
VVTDLRDVLGEALTNVARHAHAHGVEVHLALTEGQVALQVTDDGIGCAGPPKDGGLADLGRAAAVARLPARERRPVEDLGLWEVPDGAVTVVS